MSKIKRAVTQYPILDIIKNWWSPRRFSRRKEISPEVINTILEAGSWAFSAINEQPWRYVFAHCETDFYLFFNLLSEGNQPWNQNASALIIIISKRTFAANDKINITALQDVGAANMLLPLQANCMGIYTQIMGGFD